MTDPPPGELDELPAAARGPGDDDAAVLRGALQRLAADHPIHVPPARSPADAAAPPGSLAEAADILRAYLDDDDPAVTLDRAHEALALVDQVAAAGDNLLPPSVVAARLGVSVDTVRRLISEGELPAVRLGYRTLRVPVEALAAYRARLASSPRPGPTTPADPSEPPNGPLSATLSQDPGRARIEAGTSPDRHHDQEGAPECQRR